MKTDWLEVSALVGAGVAGALQIGKLAPAMLKIAAEFDIGLAGAAALLSVFSLLAALVGAGAGMLAARAGVRRALLAGCFALSGAGLVLAVAPDATTLFVARFVEGFGFLAIVVSAPSVIAARAAPADRAAAMAAWSCFMPTGIAIGLFAAPIVEAAGWRFAWGLAALLPALAGLVIMWRVPPVAVTSDGILDGLRRVWAARKPALIAAGFSCYAAIYTGIAAFLPAFLVQRFGAGVGLAGMVAALAAVANIAGNLLAGRAMAWGAAPLLLVLGGGAAMTVLAVATFVVAPGLWAALGLALVASVLGGMVPASLFALVPGSVADRALVAPALGLTVQANNLGQVVWPPVMAWCAGFGWGWMAVPFLVLGAGLLGAALALRRAG